MCFKFPLSVLVYQLIGINDYQFACTMVLARAGFISIFDGFPESLIGFKADLRLAWVYRDVI